MREMELDFRTIAVLNLKVTNLLGIHKHERVI